MRELLDGYSRWNRRQYGKLDDSAETVEPAEAIPDAPEEDRAALKAFLGVNHGPT